MNETDEIVDILKDIYSLYTQILETKKLSDNAIKVVYNTVSNIEKFIDL